jgi:hypothetical protein
LLQQPLMLRIATPRRIPSEKKISMRGTLGGSSRRRQGKGKGLLGQQWLCIITKSVVIGGSVVRHGDGERSLSLSRKHQLQLVVL